MPLGGQLLTTGLSLGNAYASAGASLGEGIRNWFLNDAQNNRAKAQTIGMVAADPSILQQFTDPVAQKALTKVRDGSASSRDIWTAYGAVTAARQSKQELLQNQFLRAQAQFEQARAAAAQQEASNRQNATDNLSAVDFAQRNPYIASNAAVSRGQAIASDPMFGAVRSFARFAGAPPTGPQMAQLVDTQANTQSREAVAAARAEAAQAVQAAKNGEPRFFTDPATKGRLAVFNGQIVKVGNATAKHPLIHAIDEAAASGEITKAEATTYKKKVFEKAGEFSPNGVQALVNSLGGVAQSPSTVSSVPEFPNIAAAEAAVASGAIKRGSKVKVAGTVGTIN